MARLAAATAVKGRLSQPAGVAALTLSSTGTSEDAISAEATDALAALTGLDVRRMFSRWGFYRDGLLFAAAWEGAFRFRGHRDGRWHYTPVDQDLLLDPTALVAEAERVLAALDQVPKPKRRPSGTRQNKATNRG